MTKLSARYINETQGSGARCDLNIMTTIKQQQICARCQAPILDEYITSVLNQWWHEKCLRCADCERQLTETCYARNGNTYCRDDFYRRFAPRCSGCGEVFHPTDLVRKARDAYFHVICFMCGVCGRQLHTGDQLFILGENTFVCKDDYLAGNHSSTILNEFVDDDGDDDFEDDDLPPDSNDPARGVSPCQTGSSSLNLYDGQHSSGSRASPSGASGHKSNGLNNDSQNDSEDGGYDDPDKKKDDNGNKRRGPRTTIKAKQLEVLKTAFSQTPKPTRHIREQLAKDTGLPMRVIQVWFQNKRSKERRLKQMCSRSKFFMGPHGALKMRKFGIDDGRFYFFDGRSDFGYPYPPDFFPHPPQGMPFPPSGPSSLMDQPLNMNMLPLPPVPHLLHDGQVDPDDESYPTGGPPSSDGFMQSLLPNGSSLDADSLATSLKSEITDLSMQAGGNSDSTDGW